MRHDICRTKYGVHPKRFIQKREQQIILSIVNAINITRYNSDLFFHSSQMQIKPFILNVI